ncbi:MAG: hypothetical protein K2X29_06430 [Candidatus Obscuribacterales bacterium]|nr:hypothetical protein [Candidatus Obscuribacterales bacterium]
MMRRLFLIATLLFLSCGIALPCLAISGVNQEMADVLSQRPEFMHLDYFEHLIGRPFNENGQRFGQRKSYYWRNANHQVTYELHQFERSPGEVVTSNFIMHLPVNDISMAQVAANYGPNGHRLYDSKGSVCTAYSYAPYTSLIFATPQESWQVQEVKVMYSGPPLKRPDLEELHDVEVGHIGRLTPAIVRHGRWDIPITPLSQHLKRHPYDGEARYQLAQAHRVHGHVDVAINEYKAAWACAGDDDELKAACIAGLAELRALPAPYVNSDVVANQPEHVVTNWGNRMRYSGDHNIYYDDHYQCDHQEENQQEQESQLAQNYRRQNQQVAGLARQPVQ